MLWWRGSTSMTTTAFSGRPAFGQVHHHSRSSLCLCQLCYHTVRVQNNDLKCQTIPMGCQLSRLCIMITDKRAIMDKEDAEVFEVLCASSDTCVGLAQRTLRIALRR